MTFSASITTHDAAARRDVTADLVSFSGVARALKLGEWDCELNPSVWSDLAAMRPGQDEAPLLLSLRWADSGRGVVMSGPVRTMTWEQSSSGVPSVLLSGVDEWAWLGARLVWPQPADLPPWATDTYHSVTGQASAVVAELIRRHVGDLARTDRRVAGLTVVDQGVGVTGTWKYRLSTLDRAVEDIASTTGLAVDVRRTPSNTVEVNVGPVRNRSALVLDESKLAEYSVVLAANSTTTVVAGGSGDGTARLFASSGMGVAGAARIESFSDQRNIDTAATLQRAADANRSVGAASASLTGTLTAAAASRYLWREHYALGDTIPLRVAGMNVSAAVTAVTVTVDNAGLRLTPVFGVQPVHALDQLLLDVAGLADRLNTLEVN